MTNDDSEVKAGDILRFSGSDVEWMVVCADRGLVTVVPVDDKVEKDMTDTWGRNSLTFFPKRPVRKKGE